MIEQISYKKFFKNYLILIGVMTVIFGLLIYIIKITQKSWSKNLKASVETVLEDKNPGTWSVGNSISINNPFCLNAACYETRNKKSGELCTAIILRVNTFYGTIPAVFVCDRQNNVTFIGYSSLHGRVAVQLESSRNGKQIEYWIKKIPDILGNRG